MEQVESSAIQVARAYCPIVAFFDESQWEMYRRLVESTSIFAQAMRNEQFSRED